MNRTEIISELRSEVKKELSDIESSTELKVRFMLLSGSHVVAQYGFDPHSNTPTIFLRSDWQDVDVAHELTHMKLELMEGYAVLAWRHGVAQSRNVESAFGRVRSYVDDEVVHARLATEGYAVDGEVLRPQLFDDVYTKVPRHLAKLRPRVQNGMAHLDANGYGELCRSSFLIQADLIIKKYASVLSTEHLKKAKRFIDTFRTYRSAEAKRADIILQFFADNNVNSQEGHKAILSAWSQFERLDTFVGLSVYRKQDGRYNLPWP